MKQTKQRFCLFKYLFICSRNRLKVIDIPGVTTIHNNYLSFAMARFFFLCFSVELWGFLLILLLPKVFVPT